MKLISMTDFVLEQWDFAGNTNSEKLLIIAKYAKLLKQPLELWMFVPCDEDNNILEEPIETIGGVELYYKKYQQAKERCLFECISFNFETKYQYFLISNKGYDISFNKKMKQSIESLIKYDLQLTQTTIEQLGL